jgi:hypothetical protein
VSSLHPNIDEGTFIEGLLSDEKRRMLLDFLAGSSPRARSILELISVVAPKCRATPSQLREAVALLRAESDREAREVLIDLLLHADIPEDVLMDLADDDDCLAVLGHRAGPRRLLEKLAEKYRYPEAITTLALYYYGTEEESAASFRAFLERYEDVPMLEHNLQSAKGLSEKKRKIVREVWGDP